MWNGARPQATPDARRRGVLAFTCAVHVLALFLWTQERRLLPVRPPETVTILLQPDRGRAARPSADTALLPLHAPSMPSMPAAPAIAVPSPQPEPVRRDDDAQAAAERTAARTSEQISEHISEQISRQDPPAPAAPATAPSATDSAPASNPIDTAQAVGPAADARALARTPAGASSAQGGLAAGLARQQAGRIDRELRKGKPGVPTEADTPAARFQRGLESAYIDRSLTLQSDTYTSPDGVVIYRFRQGNRYRCRRAGGVGMPLAGMPGTGSITAGGAGAAGATDCPKGVVWNQDP